MTSVRKSERSALLTLAALPRPLDDLQPHDYDTLDAIHAQLGDLFRRLGEEVKREAARKPQDRPRPKRPKPDPPELQHGKVMVGARSRGLCEAGTKVCTGEGQHIHHRKLRSAGGSHDPRNLLEVCNACHDYIHANPGESYPRGWLLHSWENEGREVTG